MQYELAALSSDHVHVVALRSEHDVQHGQPVIVIQARRHNWKGHRSAVRGMVTGALLVAGFFTFPFGRMMGAWLSYAPSGLRAHSSAPERTVAASSAITAVSSLYCRLSDDAAGSSTTTHSYQPFTGSVWTQGLASAP